MAVRGMGWMEEDSNDHQQKPEPCHLASPNRSLGGIDFISAIDFIHCDRRSANCDLRTAIGD